MPEAENGIYEDKVSVLLVDDRPENLIALESLLASEGNVNYLFANSGEEALKIALAEELALILLDVQMPNMNGFEVARYLQNSAKTREIPIIFVTAIDSMSSHVEEGFKVGAVDFMFKPLHPFITRSKVNTFVRIFRQKKALEHANAVIRENNRQLEVRVEERTKELTKINRELDNFIYIASHDLKAPIHNIEGLMSLLEKALEQPEPDSDRVRKIEGMINESVERFKKTVRDLTVVAKTQYEEEEEHSEVVFSELMTEVKTDIGKLINESDAVLHEDFSQAPKMVFSRKNLRSILYNLTSNAIKYRDPGRVPEIRISTKKQNGYTCIAVQDNGLGIRKEDQEKLYGMFKRLHSHVEGSGVGMAIVKRIIENAEGNIEIESEPGKGSCFKVCLKNKEEKVSAD